MLVSFDIVSLLFLRSRYFCSVTLSLILQNIFINNFITSSKSDLLSLFFMQFICSLVGVSIYIFYDLIWLCCLICTFEPIFYIIMPLKRAGKSNLSKSFWVIDFIASFVSNQFFYNALINGSMSFLDRPIWSEIEYSNYRANDIYFW